LHSGTAHVAFGSSDSLGPCDFKDFVAQSHTPNDHCVRFAVVVTFPDATLVTKRALPLTWAGLSPAGSRQLRLAHRYSFIAVDLHHLLLAGLPAHLCENTQEPTRRRIIFSIALSQIVATTIIVFRLTKSRRIFYAKIECLCFHTASTPSGHADNGA
jgi:hypothetical protein